MADDERCESVTWVDTAMGYRDIRCELLRGHAEAQHQGHNVKWLTRWTVPKPKPEHDVSHGLPNAVWERKP